MRDYKTSNYGIAFLSVIICGGMGVLVMGSSDGIPVGLIVGVMVGLLISNLIALERIMNMIDDKLPDKKAN